MPCRATGSTGRSAWAHGAKGAPGIRADIHERARGHAANFQIHDLPQTEGRFPAEAPADRRPCLLAQVGYLRVGGRAGVVSRNSLE